MGQLLLYSKLREMSGSASLALLDHFCVLQKSREIIIAERRKMRSSKLLKGFVNAPPSLCPAPHIGKEADSGMPTSSLIGRSFLAFETHLTFST